MERNTRQKRAVWEILSQANRPLCEQEIRDAAQRLVPGIGRATVFRALRRLLMEQRAVQVQLPGHQCRYAIAGKEHHHHFVCQDCGLVFDLPDSSPDLSRLAPPQFEVNSQAIVLYGKCTICCNARRPISLAD
jgi:Fur family ferric uptake transcriptional regulator